MPTMTRYGQTRELYVDSLGRVYPDRLRTDTLFQSVKPTTIKRTRPKDLFGSGTDWSSSQKIVNPGFCEFRFTGGAYRNTSFAHAVNYYGSQKLPSREGFTLLENKVRKQIRETYVNLPVTVAEFGKTAQMFVGFIRNMREVYQKIRRLDPNLALMPYYAIREKRLRKRWLEYRYGLTPLMYEADGAMRALYAHVQRPLFIHGQVRATVNKQETYHTTFDHYDRSFSTVQVDRRLKHQQQVKFRCVVETGSLAARLSPFGLTNPILTAWELIPYSFVADWFANTGDVLASLDNLHQIKTLEVIRSSIDTISYDMVGKDSVSGNSIVIDKTWTRDRPVPISSISKLVWNPSLTTNRLIDAVALLRQAQKGPHR